MPRGLLILPPSRPHCLRFAERCHDCAELYYSCHAHPENQDVHYADYLRLPDVMPGTTGQAFPPPRMNGRKEPRIRLAARQPEPNRASRLALR